MFDISVIVAAKLLRYGNTGGSEMPLIAYRKQNVTAKKLQLISIAQGIVQEYAAQGFDMTLRQLYYQLVARGFIANHQREYKRLGDAIDTARMNGLIDWGSIVDRTRGCLMNDHWDSPAEIVEDAAGAYKIDLWKGQRRRVEVWIEKEALIGVISGLCRKWDVPYMACRGYLSQSEMWRSSQRIIRYLRKGQPTIILHLGDHDPSGIDMTADIKRRLQIFVGHEFENTDTGDPYEVPVLRLGLNMDQVQQYNPPPNPAKMNDARAAAYIAQYGHSCWELDALDPQTLTGLVESNIRGIVDLDKWNARLRKQKKQQGEIKEVAGLFRKGK